VQLAGGGLVLTIIALTVAFLTVLQQSPAVAATPPMLNPTAVLETPRELLREMADMKRQDVETGNTIRSQTWALNTTVAGDGSIVSSSVEPRQSVTTFEADGSVHYQLTAASPFPGQASKDLTKPGTVLADETFAPGEYDNPYAEPVPTDANKVGGYLAGVSGNDSITAGDTIMEVSAILSTVVLSNAQEAAILEYLSTLRTISVAGQVIDRLGRIGIAFRASDRWPGEVEDLLIVSLADGTILSAETIYTGSGRTDIPSPCVIDYTAWQR
jgi:hypothetical protein